MKRLILWILVLTASVVWAKLDYIDPLLLGQAIPLSPVIKSSMLLLETGDYFLLENGGRLLLE